MLGPNEMNSPAPDQTPAPASAPQLNGMGEVLIMGTACGHRLDKIMGEAEHWKIQRRLIDAGLLTEHGEPTPKGTAALDDFFKRRTEARRREKAEAEVKRLSKGP